MGAASRQRASRATPVARGARAVRLGRAPLYGLAGRGPAGANEVLAILRTELDNTLRLLGRTRIGALDAAAVRKR
ncbi:hypothetical protein G6F50_016496 [Rhizopus delemar]|uniref:FMN-dependent dehydrogenase domain-containing protein n=1 Tax=Rhizopus delemar TaxID=936053 RepID=A0A9P6XST4_9FUNG|nr:hypothetical protein G6F50_016496 [Rhizopus delemar]